MQSPKPNSQANRVSIATQHLEVIFDGVDIRKKAVGLAKTKRAPPSTVYQMFEDSLSKFKTVLNDKKSSQEQSVAKYEIAQTLSDKAEIMQEIGAIDGGSVNTLPTIEQAMQVLEGIPKEEVTADSERLFGKLLFEKGKRVLGNNKLEEGELLLLSASERLISSHKKQVDDENTVKILEQAYEALSSGEKQRLRFGNLIFRYCGEFMKQDSHKSWHKRFFVVDDNLITYFKQRKDWEALITTKGKPYGSIMLAEVTDVSSHKGECPHIKDPQKQAKFKDSRCVHLHTPEKVYNILTMPENPASADELATILKSVLRAYKIKKEAKAITKKKKGGSFLDTTWEVRIKGATTPTAEGSIMKKQKGSKIRKTLSWKRGEASIIPRDKSQFPDEPWSEGEEEGEDDAMDSRPQFTFKEPDTDASEFTTDKLKEKLKRMSTDEQMELVKSLLKDFEKEGNLRKLFQCLIAEDPQTYLIKLSSVDSFDMAKFGVLQKSGALLKK